MAQGIEEVTINDNTYTVRGAIVESFVEEFPDAERQTALQQLSDRRGKSSWLVDEVLGIGQFYTTEVEKKVKVQKSLAETRFGEITHRPLVQDSTGQTLWSDSNQNIVVISFAGDVGWFFPDNDADSDINAGTWDGATDTWQSEAIVYSYSSDSNPHAAHVLDDSLYVYFVRSGNLYVYKSTAWASGWDAPSGSGKITGDLASIVDSDTLKVITWSPTITVVAWFSPNTNKCIVVKNSNNWATLNPSTIATISCGALNAIGIYYDLTGNLKVIVGLDNGVWAIDLQAIAGESLVVDLTSQTDANNCKGMTVWNGQLIVPLGSGGVEGRIWTGGSMTSFSMPPGRLPSGWEGHVTASLPSDEWLLLAYGGHESGNTAHIFAVDLDHQWHTLVEHDTANKEITHMIASGYDDSQVRLHFFEENGDDIFHIDDPFTNPRHKSIPNEASNQITLSEFTGGFPNTPKLLLQLLVDAEDLSATNSDQFINVDYGIDDNTVDTDLGDFLSGDKDLVFGASSEGVEAKSVTIQLDLKRDATVNTDRSYVRSLELEYLVIPDRRETYEMVIDIQASAKIRETTVATIVSELNAIQASKTMVTFTFDGRSNVHVIAEPKTVTEHEMEELFGKKVYRPRTDRYLKLTELL